MDIAKSREKINNRTQTIVCLPHKLVVEIEEVENSDDSQSEKRNIYRIQFLNKSIVRL